MRRNASERTRVYLYSRIFDKLKVPRSDRYVSSSTFVSTINSLIRYSSGWVILLWRDFSFSERSRINEKKKAGRIYLRVYGCPAPRSCATPLN